MRTLRLLAVVLAVLSPLAFGQGGTYTQIDYPGASYTQCLGINTAGTVVGAYGTQGSPNNDGFMWTSGDFIHLDYPGNASTTVYSINDHRQITGATRTTTLSYLTGFIGDLNTGSFEQINYPAGLYSYTTALNNAGVVVGSYAFRNGTQQTDLGFLYQRSTYKSVKIANSIGTQMTGVTGAGALVGFAQLRGSDVVLNFVLTSGTLTHVRIPNTQGAVVNGVNNAGTIFVGAYYSSDVGDEVGFSYQNGIVTSLEFPGAQGTYAQGVNDAGIIVGYFYDSAEIAHGFLWTPPSATQKGN